ncbi:unnamed protein product [Didymodactylos carnosus]|nr:unnamed protein product [Didymodactylos carnosus]CAF4022689.1 unnamed protein product [Didymodactylos carnosus]
MKCICVIEDDPSYSDVNIVPYMEIFSRLNSLTLKLQTRAKVYQSNDLKICEHFFREECMLETLIIKNTLTWIDARIMTPCEHLKYLTITLPDMLDIYILLNKLPLIEFLCVDKLVANGLLGNRKIINYETQQRELPPIKLIYETCLQEFKLHEATVNYEELKALLKQLKVLKRLSLINIDCIYHLIDGEELEQGFLTELKQLNKFNFRFESRARLLPVAPDYAATFQSPYWTERGWNVQCSSLGWRIWLATLET